MIDPKTEQLINRRLDGELTADEQLDLNKRLIRSPEARAMDEDYRQFDTLAHEALHDFCKTSCPESELHHRSRFELWGRGGAVAAAFVLATLLSSWLLPRTKPQTPNTDSASMLASLPIVSDIPRLLSIEGPRQEKERVQKDLIGVFDQETQSVYLLEMDQQQTTVVPVTMNY